MGNVAPRPIPLLDSASFGIRSPNDDVAAAVVAAGGNAGVPDGVEGDRDGCGNDDLGREWHRVHASWRNDEQADELY